MKKKQPKLTHGEPSSINAGAISNESNDDIFLMAQKVRQLGIRAKAVETMSIVGTVMFKKRIELD